MNSRPPSRWNADGPPLNDAFQTRPSSQVSTKWTVWPLSGWARATPPVSPLSAMARAKAAEARRRRIVGSVNAAGGTAPDGRRIANRATDAIGARSGRLPYARDVTAPRTQPGETDTPPDGEPRWSRRAFLGAA